MKKLIFCLLVLGLAVFPVKEAVAAQTQLIASISWIKADLETGVRVLGQPGEGKGFGYLFSKVESFSNTGKTYIEARTRTSNYVKVTDVDAAVSFARVYSFGNAFESVGQAGSFAEIHVKTVATSVGNAESASFANGYLLSWLQAKPTN